MGKLLHVILVNPMKRLVFWARIRNRIIATQVHETLYIERERYKTAIWVAPKKWGSNANEVSQHRIDFESWSFPNSSQKLVSSDMNFFLMPDGLRVDYLIAAIIWLLAFLIGGAFFQTSVNGDCTVCALLSSLEGWVWAHGLLPYLEYIVVVIVVLACAPLLYSLTYNLMPLIVPALGVCFFVMVGLVWVLHGLVFQPDLFSVVNIGAVPVLAAMVGFFVIFLFAPWLIYGLLRKHLPISLDRVVPKGYRNEWAHVPQAVMVSRGGFHLRLLIYLAFPYLLNNRNEPIYWHSTPNSRQKGMVNYCSQMLVQSLLAPARPSKIAYLSLFYMGPVIVPYFGLWIMHLLKIYSPAFLACVAIAWAALSSFHTMVMTHRLFVKKRQAVAKWFPRSFSQAFRDIADAYNLENDRIRKFTYWGTQLIFTVLLGIYLSYLDLEV